MERETCSLLCVPAFVITIVFLFWFWLFVFLAYYNRIYLLFWLNPSYLTDRRVLRQVYYLRMGYCVCFVWDRIMCLFTPFSLRNHYKKIKSGEFTPINLSRYLKDCCWDSKFPDQVKFREMTMENFYFYSAYLVDQDLIDVVFQFDSVDRYFEFDQLNDVVLDRFTELMPSVTLLQFSKLSKDVYRKCLEIRGFEYDSYYYNPSIRKEFTSEIEENNQTDVSTNGRLVGLSLEGDLDKLVNCMGSLRAEGWCTAVHFVPNYKRLILEFKNSNFGRYYKASLEHYLHDRLESIAFFICLTESDQVERTKLQDLMNCLTMCTNIPKIGVSFEQTNLAIWESSAWDIRFDSLLDDNSSQQEIKTAIEAWTQTRPDLVFFKLIYHYVGFVLHGGKLKAMRPFMTRRWYLTEDYTEANYYTAHLHFYNDLMLPYDEDYSGTRIYGPFSYFDHIM